jgi:hypothetical protein
MKGWSERTWKTKEGAVIHVEASTPEECRRLFRARVKHLHQWEDQTEEVGE